MPRYERVGIMPSKHQVGNDSKEYRNHAHKFMQTKPKDLILMINPQTEEAAREWLGEANKKGDKEIVKHFVEQVERLK